MNNNYTNKTVHIKDGKVTNTASCFRCKYSDGEPSVEIGLIPAVVYKNINFDTVFSNSAVEIRTNTSTGEKIDTDKKFTRKQIIKLYNKNCDKKHIINTPD